MELVHSKSNPLRFLVDEQAYEGVKRIAGKVAEDFKRVSGQLPVVNHGIRQGKEAVILFATLGKSPLLEQLEAEGRVNLAQIQGKREVFQITMLEGMLVVVGSDKRGTIYGMFSLSEYIGVSPLHFWGDVVPEERAEIRIRADICQISKEPSVRHRGFFINDEWPCFGNWTFEKFGGFNATMYDHVFELLLRLKGNYLWPAMWTSSFPLDGPGNANEELAHMYGVVVGASHHEPCLRASEEWDLVRGPDSLYGNEWNHYTNKEGLLKYWEDGLKRSGHLEKIIMLGMRGERDSSVLGDQASVRENVELLKEIINNQRKLVAEHVTSDSPLMIALYKEVEEYFYGNDEVEGLKDWDGLNDVICMLCEDNFGFVRSLPTKDLGERRYGMYYHFDYHGGPISYEWMPSTTFERTKDQMSMAYEYGIRDVWVVNVGDLKGNEVPLSFFMALAYDFEKYGTATPDAVEIYTTEWVEKTFPQLALEGTTSAGDPARYQTSAKASGSSNLASSCRGLERGVTLVGNTTKCLANAKASGSSNIAGACRELGREIATVKERISQVLHGYIRINSFRRPEALNASVYHPCHYLESDRMLDTAKSIEEMNEYIYEVLEGNGKDAYYSMIYIPAKASVNLLRMHLYSAKNIHYAKQGKKIANHYQDLVTECLARDKEIMADFATFKESKWKGMELEEHIGFTVWNEDNCRNPLRVQVEPFHKPRLVVNRKDEAKIYHKTYGMPMKIKVNDFLYEGNKIVALEVSNDGVGELSFQIEWESKVSWLSVGVGAEEVLNPDGKAEKALHGDGKLENAPEVGVRADDVLDRGLEAQETPEREACPMARKKVFSVATQRQLVFFCDRSKLSQEKEQALLSIKGEDGTLVIVKVLGKATDTSSLPTDTFLENRGVFAIESNHFAKKTDTKKGGFQELLRYGRSGTGMKVFPVTASFTKEEERPSLIYRILVASAGEYTVEVWTTPTNSLERQKPLRFTINEKMVTAISDEFNAGDPGDQKWCRGILDNIRKTSCELTFDSGVQDISIQPLEAGLIIERILIYKRDSTLPESYLGPIESFYT